MSLLYAIHQQYKLLLYICTRSEVWRHVPPTRAVIKGTASLHSTQELGLELELFGTVRHACCGLDMSLLCMQCLWRSVCVGNAHTPHTHQGYNGNYFTL